MNEEYLEKESDAPEDWRSNIILQRNANGEMEEVIVEDDIAENDDGGVGDA